MAQQDVQNILQGLISGQQLQQSRIAQSLEYQRQQAEAEYRQKQLQHEHDILEETKKQNAAMIAQQQSNLRIQQALAMANPAVLQTMGTQVGPPKPDGTQDFSIDLGNGPIIVNNRTLQQTQDAAMKLKAAELAATIAANVSQAKQIGELPLTAAERERVRQEAANRASSERITGANITGNPGLLNMGAPAPVSAPPAIPHTLGDQIAPPGASSQVQAIQDYQREVNSIADQGWNWSQHEAGLRQSGAPKGAIASGINSIYARNGRLATPEDYKEVAALQTIANNFIPKLAEFNRLSDGAGTTLMNWTKLGTMKQDIDSYAQGLAKAFGDTSLRSSQLIQQAADAFMPDRSSKAWDKGANNWYKFTSLLTRYRNTLDSVLSGVSNDQREAIMTSRGLNSPMGLPITLEKGKKPSDDVVKKYIDAFPPNRRDIALQALKAGGWGDN